MSWIEKHWDDNYAAAANAIIKDLVRCVTSTFTIQFPEIFFAQMRAYRAQEPNHQPQPTAPALVSDQPAIMALAAQYGIPDMMVSIEQYTTHNADEMTVDEEYFKYLSAPATSTTILGFWEVRYSKSLTPESFDF